jgi:hypothetical protein
MVRIKEFHNYLTYCTLSPERSADLHNYWTDRRGKDFWWMDVCLCQAMQLSSSFSATETLRCGVTCGLTGGVGGFLRIARRLVHNVLFVLFVYLVIIIIMIGTVSKVLLIESKSHRETTDNNTR